MKRSLLLLVVAIVLILVFTFILIVLSFQKHDDTKNPISEKRKEIETKQVKEESKEEKYELAYLELMTNIKGRFILRDPTGKKTGYNYATGEEYDEISGSFFYFDEAYGDPTGQKSPPPPDAGARIIEVKNPGKQDFTLEISGHSEFGVSFATKSYETDDRFLICTKTSQESCFYNLVYKGEFGDFPYEISEID